MEFTKIRGIETQVSRLGLGTWSIGGWCWGGTEEKEAIATIQYALDLGINLLDTAPVYGFGVAESIVAKAITNRRSHVILATKTGLKWDSSKRIYRDSSEKQIRTEIEQSLKRLKTDWIDLYQVHWPDEKIAFEKTAKVLQALKAEGKIRSIGVSNYSYKQIEQFGEPDVLQSPYNLFEREIEDEIPLVKKKGIALLGYGTICRGLLAGKINEKTQFKGDDLRKVDPKFSADRLPSYVKCVKELDSYSQQNFRKPVIALAIRWALDQGIDVPLVGCRRKEQLSFFEDIWNWKLTAKDLLEIEKIVQLINDPVGPQFMAPK